MPHRVSTSRQSIRQMLGSSSVASSIGRQPPSNAGQRSAIVSQRIRYRRAGSRDPVGQADQADQPVGREQSGGLGQDGTRILVGEQVEHVAGDEAVELTVAAREHTPRRVDQHDLGPWRPWGQLPARQRGHLRADLHASISRAPGSRSRRSRAANRPVPHPSSNTHRARSNPPSSASRPVTALLVEELRVLQPADPIVGAPRPLSAQWHNRAPLTYPPHGSPIGRARPGSGRSTLRPSRRAARRHREAGARRTAHRASGPRRLSADLIDTASLPQRSLGRAPQTQIARRDRRPRRCQLIEHPGRQLACAPSARPYSVKSTWQWREQLQLRDRIDRLNGR